MGAYSVDLAALMKGGVDSGNFACHTGISL